MIFETERLEARHLVPGDLEDLCAVYGDADAMRLVGDSWPLDREQCTKWIAVTARNVADHGYGMTTLVLKDSGATAGFCGLVHHPGQPGPEIKYALRRAYWGTGLATEAARGMLAHAAGPLGLPRVWSTIHPDNAASIRIMLKIGMSPLPSRVEADGSETLVFATPIDETTLDP